MTKVDIISGFLGAGKTTFIKKLLSDVWAGEKLVLIENEFGEIGIDGGFLKDSGIEIREMNSGCICCSLVGDFGASLKEVVEKYHPDRILILGTSDRMVVTITKALDLPEPCKYIRIEDVARPEEMMKASEARHKEGKHVIPVPTMELKPYFKGYLVDPLKFFRNRKKEAPKRFSEQNERSVVRPVFSYYGKLSFSDRVIASLVRYAVKGMKKVRITGVSSQKSESQMNGLILALDVTVRSGTPQDIKTVIHTMRDRIQREIEHTTGMSLETIRVNVTTGVVR